MIEYLRSNLLPGFRQVPRIRHQWIVLLILAFGAISWLTGTAVGLFEFQILTSKNVFLLVFMLFLFPVLLEEAFFRGILIPRDTLERGGRSIAFYTVLSSSLFVVWHPLNALTINHGAIEIFINPWFLVIVFLLGIVTSLSYISSKSIWVPILIHWITVFVWVVFLGGRNALVGV